MIDAAEASGELTPGGTIVEPTSGNTGVGLALVAQRRGYKCVFVCPDKVSEDKQNVLRAYGAEVVVRPMVVPPYYRIQLLQRVQPPRRGDRRCVETRATTSIPNGPVSHYETTGPEIWDDTDGKVTHFVAGVGTGGTITGAGRYLKEVSDGRVQIIGADPEGSVYSGGSGRPYLVEGVGEDFWPSAYDPTVPDEIIAVSDADSFDMTRRLAREEALLVGGSCGMAVVVRPWRNERARIRSSWCCCRMAGAVICQRFSTIPGCPRTAFCAAGSTGRSSRPRSAMCCGASPVRCPTWCTHIRRKPCVTRSASWVSTGCPRCRSSVP